jgi:hypothetical protein
MAFTALMSELDTTVQELRLEAHRGAFTDRLAHIVSTLGMVPDSLADEVTAEDVTRLGELVDESVDAIERRIDAQLDGQDVQQRLAGTIYELRKRLEAINLWFRHSRSVPS